MLIVAARRSELVAVSSMCGHVMGKPNLRKDVINENRDLIKHTRKQCVPGVLFSPPPSTWVEG